MAHKKKTITRRDFIKQSAGVAAAATLACAAPYGWASMSPAAKKFVVIGMDGMDPRLVTRMIEAGRLPNFAKLAQQGGFRPLGTSTPPQSPVAWGNFINGAGPGSHGIFDFIHRDPKRQCHPFFAGADTLPGSGYWETGDHKLQLDFWPFNHQPAQTTLSRKGTPFWDYLDGAGIESTFYNLPTNYPPSPSKHGHHRCLSGMGTPDMLGSYGTYQHFAEDGPIRTRNEGGGKRSRIRFDNETGRAEIIGPAQQFLRKKADCKVPFTVHRDRSANSCALDIQGQRLLLKQGQWSQWVKLDMALSMPWFSPDHHMNGICRFYLQEVAPNFRLYVTPINNDPSDPATPVSEPNEFVKDISRELGLFYNTGFQEDHKALSNKVFSDQEYMTQADYVLDERLNLLEYANKNYDDGLLFFYFSSTDLQAHMLWWDGDDNHPTRSTTETKDAFEHLQGIYTRMDDVLGDMLKRYGKEATVMVLSDHGFANFGRQFHVNTWLRDHGYIMPSKATSILIDNDWRATKAFALGINGVYLNQRGRERDGIVSPGAEREELLQELVTGFEAIRDTNGQRVINKAYRSDQVFSGKELAFAPDIILGCNLNYRASWDTCLGGIGDQVLSDNDSTWGADHCADPAVVPGVLLCNRPIDAKAPNLTDLAPTILNAFGQPKPSTMTGNKIFA